MGTESKSNCYTENSSTGGNPKVFKGSSCSSSSATLSLSVQRNHKHFHHQQQSINILNSSNNVVSKPNHHHQLNAKDSDSTIPTQTTTTTTTTTTKSSIPLNHGENQLAEAQAVGTVPYVPITIDENDVIEGAKNILKVIRPHWDLNQVQFKKFTDGITNKLVGCFYTATTAATTTTTATSLQSSICNMANGHPQNDEDDDAVDDDDDDDDDHHQHQRRNSTAINDIEDATSNNANHHHQQQQNPTTTNGIATIFKQHDDTNDSGHISDTDYSYDDATTDTQPQTSANMPTQSTDNVVLVRVYGNKTDLLIDRKAETQNFLLLHSYGLAPSLYATFKNGLAYDYVPGCTLNTESVLRPEIWRLVAQRMAEMHRVVVKKGAPTIRGDFAILDAKTVDGDIVPMLWKKTQSFLDLVPEQFSDADKHKRIERTFLPISRLRDEFEKLYEHLASLNSPLVFSHNDLLLGNVIYTESLQMVSFIDYEYADYNFQAFDIGNHFAEFAGVDQVDYTRYPKRDFQLAWIRVYLQSYLGRNCITNAEVERLYVQVNQFALASHFFWTIWSLIQAEHSKIDFDYVDYAYLRYNEYLARKKEFLALSINKSS